MACHFWRDIPVPAALAATVQGAPARERLLRLQSAFAAPAI